MAVVSNVCHPAQEEPRRRDTDTARRRCPVTLILMLLHNPKHSKSVIPTHINSIGFADASFQSASARALPGGVGDGEAGFSSN
jgi:hypothetical protein